MARQAEHVQPYPLRHRYFQPRLALYYFPKPHHLPCQLVFDQNLSRLQRRNHRKHCLLWWVFRIILFGCLHRKSPSQEHSVTIVIAGRYITCFAAKKPANKRSSPLVSVFATAEGDVPAPGICIDLDKISDIGKKPTYRDRIKLKVHFLQFGCHL